MKFKLSSVKGYFNNKEGPYNDKAEIEVMKKLGFEFEFYKEGELRLIENNDLTIEINTLDDMMNLIGKVEEVMLSEEYIIIYNAYTE